MVVRSDLTQPHLTVQASHAAIAATYTFGEHPCPHLILCTAADEPALNALFNRLKEQQVPVCGFYEDDWTGKPLTAIATGCLRGEQRKPLRRLPLLK